MTFIITYLCRQGTTFHFLETESQDTISISGFNDLFAQVQCTGTGGAIVVYVEYWNTGHTDFIQGTLARCGVAIHITDSSLLNLIVGNLSVSQSLCNGFLGEIGIADTFTATRFLELESKQSLNNNNFQTSTFY